LIGFEKFFKVKQDTSNNDAYKTSLENKNIFPFRLKIFDKADET
jgi:hypothetical protein